MCRSVPTNRRGVVDDNGGRQMVGRQFQKVGRRFREGIYIKKGDSIPKTIGDVGRTELKVDRF